MSFLSFNFAIFLGVALAMFYAAPARWRPALLLVLSYLFYLTWSVPCAVLLAAVTAGVYATGLWIERQRTERGKRAWAALGVMVLVVLLFAFKAGTWIVNVIFPRAGPGMVILLPLGLSYYVFKMAGYLLDVYWETLPAQRDFVALALYGSFFPQIVSGPIQRAESFFGQLERLHHPDAGEFLTGLRRILFGLFKKIAIADRLGIMVANAHSNPARFSSLELLTAAYCFSIQLYADFSGITDIAIGIGLLFGIRGPENFDLPYFAPTIQLFWRRMHMSLTNWLTDYLFTPMRMSLRNWGNIGLCAAIFVNTVAIGLWHGLAWTFLIFGIMHGVYVSVSVLTIKRRNAFFKSRPALARARTFLAPLGVFHMVVFSHIFFRAATLGMAVKYIEALIPGTHANAIPALRFDPGLLGLPARGLALCLAAYLATEWVTWLSRTRAWVEKFFAMPMLLRRSVYYGLAAVVLFMFKGAVTFIYARF